MLWPDQPVEWTIFSDMFRHVQIANVWVRSTWHVSHRSFSLRFAGWMASSPIWNQNSFQSCRTCFVHDVTCGSRWGMILASFQDGFGMFWMISDDGLCPKIGHHRGIMGGYPEIHWWIIILIPLKQNPFGGCRYLGRTGTLHRLRTATSSWTS